MAKSGLLKASTDRRLEKAGEDDPAAGSAPQAPAAAPPVSAPPAGRAPAADHALTGSIVANVPSPHDAQGDGDLTATEAAELQMCEGALQDLQLAFWRAGKALNAIRNGRLYRETHGTFEEYLRDRWGMSRPQAYRLIDAWPLAEQLSPIGDKLTESHVRVLLPLTMRHGQQAAVVVYETIAQADGVTVTAKVLEGAIAALPEDHFDPAEATERIRAFLSGDVKPPETAPRPRVPGSFTDVSRRIVLDLSRVSTLRGEPAAMRVFVDQVKQLIGALEAQLPSEH
jgi:hypothetical protein